MIRRRQTQVFSMAFLDCICCGFGAVILVFVLSVAGQDMNKQTRITELQALMEEMARRLADLNASREDLLRDNSRIASILSDARMRNAAILALLDELERRLAYEKAGAEALVVDLDDLQKEIAARQRERSMILDDVEPLPVGVPVGSNYIAFVIDTSGSMRDPFTDRLHPVVIRKIEEVLEVYPIVDGIQVLDADGRFLVREGNGNDPWIPDSPQIRESIKEIIRRHDNTSYSNPVPGLVRVFRELYREDDPNMELGVYIFGDEYNGISEPVIRRIDELNPIDPATGERKAVINAIGFPTLLDDSDLNPENTMLKYANLMREICYQHGGAFIALDDL
jgi:hypothetical protein